MEHCIVFVDFHTLSVPSGGSAVDVWFKFRKLRFKPIKNSTSLDQRTTESRSRAAGTFRNVHHPSCLKLHPLVPLHPLSSSVPSVPLRAITPSISSLCTSRLSRRLTLISSFSFLRSAACEWYCGGEAVECTSTRVRRGILSMSWARTRVW